MAVDHSPLAVPRQPSRRLRANCRNFAVLLVSLLRHRRVPARRRVGFARYLPGRHAYIHEIAEYWDRRRGWWVLVDPQNGAVTHEAQRAYIESIGQPERACYDTLDLSASGRPDDQFILAGQAWRLCRAGLTEPEVFRAPRCRGLREIGSAVLQDLDDLAKRARRSNDSGLAPLAASASEAMPRRAQSAITAEEEVLVELGAELSLAPNWRFEEARAFCRGLVPVQVVGAQS